METFAVNGLAIEVAVTQNNAHNFIQANFKGTGGVLYLQPYGKTGFEAADLELACANSLADLMQALKPLTESQRRYVAELVWPERKVPDDLIWHLSTKTAGDGNPYLELVVATRQTMSMLVATFHCKFSLLFE